MLACNFLWRNVRKQRKKKRIVKLEFSPSLLQAVLQGFHGVFLNDWSFSSCRRSEERYSGGCFQTHTDKVLLMGASRGKAFCEDVPWWWWWGLIRRQVSTQRREKEWNVTFKYAFPHMRTVYGAKGWLQFEMFGEEGQNLAPAHSSTNSFSTHSTGYFFSFISFFFFFPVWVSLNLQHNFWNDQHDSLSNIHFCNGKKKRQMPLNSSFNGFFFFFLKLGWMIWGLRSSSGSSGWPESTSVTPHQLHPTNALAGFWPAFSHNYPPHVLLYSTIGSTYTISATLLSRSYHRIHKHNQIRNLQKLPSDTKQTHIKMLLFYFFFSCVSSVSW